MAVENWEAVSRNFLRRSTCRNMLRAEVSEVGMLRAVDINDMFGLFRLYYTHVTIDRFANDLAAKDTILVLRDDESVIKGFSTLSVTELSLGDEPIRVVFSGDTVIDKAHWGSHAFAANWIRQIARIAAQAPHLRHYWLLIVKGHRTYKYLPTFAHHFVPDWRSPERTDLDEIKDAIARTMFGEHYDPSSSILRYESSRGQLTPEMAEPGERERQRGDVGFFLRRNPGYVNGDELVCLCEITSANMKPFARRIFEQAMTC